MGVIVSADLGGDGQAGRHRQAQIAHLRQVGALATQQIAHLGFAIGLAVAERIDPLTHHSPPRSWPANAGHPDD